MSGGLTDQGLLELCERNPYKPVKLRYLSLEAAQAAKEALFRSTVLGRFNIRFYGTTMEVELSEPGYSLQG